MQAGRLDTTVSIWRNLGTSSYGEVTEDWQMVYQMRAAVSVQNSRRALDMGEMWYPRAASFRIRLGYDVRRGDRVLHEGDYYDIISVNVDRSGEKCITINTELHNE